MRAFPPLRPLLRPSSTTAGSFSGIFRSFVEDDEIWTLMGQGRDFQVFPNDLGRPREIRRIPRKRRFAGDAYS
jgi:hypothetical protein